MEKVYIKDNSRTHEVYATLAMMDNMAYIYKTQHNEYYVFDKYGQSLSCQKLSIHLGYRENGSCFLRNNKPYKVIGDDEVLNVNGKRERLNTCILPGDEAIRAKAFKVKLQENGCIEPLYSKLIELKDGKRYYFQYETINGEEELIGDLYDYDKYTITLRNCVSKNEEKEEVVLLLGF